ncbi:hypothetical protein SH501x_002911 [Pirellulaceae bacterium SH501]
MMEEGGSLDTSFYFAQPNWIPWVLLVGFLLLIASIISYRGSRMPMRYRFIAIAMRSLGIGLLLACLLEPMGSIEKAKPQANAFALLVDNSQSVRETWKSIGLSKGYSEPLAWAQDQLMDETDWVRKLGEEFRLRRYLFDYSLHAIDSFEGIQQSGNESVLIRSLESLFDRYETPNGSASDSTRGQPLAGVLLFSDGQATDGELLAKLRDLPVPIYPVVYGESSTLRDLAIVDVTTQQSDFETAPITLSASIAHIGFENKKVTVELRDTQGKEIETKSLTLASDEQTSKVEFRFRPTQLGAQGYQLSVKSNDEGNPNAAPTEEWTLLNNKRYQLIDRGRGPYRILYVAGRPNWEHKFLSRALSEDQEVELTSLIRIAKKEPKFSFRDNRVDSSNPLFSGFEDITEEEKEQYDEPVYVRLGVKESGELQKGFPKDLGELYQYRAIVLDDIEPEFFTQEQQSMLRQFVSIRGGGLLALGGQEAMRGSEFSRSVLSQLLPIYADSNLTTAADLTADPNQEAVASIRMQLSRDGWLQPFMRLADSEAGEKKRLESMPGFQVFNRVRDLKPGSSVLAEGMVEGDSESSGPIPLLVTQRFGRGRTAAFLVGDWWRWAMRREGKEPTPLYQAWRQLFRWLITDVPKSLEVVVKKSESNDRARGISVDVKGSDFKALDNAVVQLIAQKPDGSKLELMAEASPDTPGRYETVVLSDDEGVYTVEAKCSGPDGSDLGTVESGWVHEPLAMEFKGLGENRELLNELAEKSGGKVIQWDELDSFVKNVPSDQVPVKEKRVFPLWHQSWVIVAAIACLCFEWGWRRRYGMA